jgi:hypothetical protein
MQTWILCNHCANKLTKFIKKSKKIHRCSFDSTLSIYKISIIKSLYLSYTKKRKFWQICEIRSVRNFVFLLLFHSYNFNVKILYIVEVGSKEHMWMFSDLFMNFVSSFVW